MSIVARSVIITHEDSFETGREAAAELAMGFEQAPKIIVTYTTVNHDQEAYLRGVRDVLGPRIPVIGCCAQGVIGRGRVREDGYGATALALGGDSIDVAHASVTEIELDTRQKGKELGRMLRAQLARPAGLAVLHYDPVCGVDIGLLMEGLYSEIECKIVGGGAAHSFNFEALQQTYQHHGDRVMSRAAVAFAISGSFSAEMDICHGCSPVGVELTVTRSEGSLLRALDGRPAADVWADICGPLEEASGHMAALAIGVPVPGATSEDEYLVRAGYAIDPETRGVVVGSHIPVGTRIMLHHRTVEHVLEGARQMGASLRERLAGKRPRAAFAFECGARSRPFLGDAATRKENLGLQEAIGSDIAWIGMMAWGEIFPVGGKPTFHNYAYPVLVIGD